MKMKIIVLKEFYDREAGMILRTPGEVCEADEKRAVFLIDRGLVKEVKEKVIQIQRNFGNSNNVVMDGRDIGTRIFPNAEIKFYLEASPEVRARRKFLEGKDKKLSYEDILKKLIERDKIEIAAKSILIPKDAFMINTDNMTFEEVSEKILQITMQRMNAIER